MSNTPEFPLDDQGRFVMDDLVLAPASESGGRAALLPAQPSEDARHVLGTIELSDARPADAEQDYLPEPPVEWVVDVRLHGDPHLNPQAVRDAFDTQWRNAYGRMVEYGRDVATGRWTYLNSADGPEVVDQLKLGFDYLDVLDDEAPLPVEEIYAERLAQIKQRMGRFGSPNVSASLAPPDAARRSRLLRDLKRELDMTAVLIVQAPAGQRFEGKAVWDVLRCLGLEWGDMDCFHWQNQTGEGDDSFFSVETTTPPGYFLPEEVAADRVRIDDLVFVYSVPRCARPVEVFDAMLRGAEYCRSRLGGSVLTEHGKPVNSAALRLRIGEVAERLRANGFEPGAGATLRLF